MEVESTHPLAAIILRNLLGIESYSKVEQMRMVRRVCKPVVDWHEKEIAALKAEIERKDIALHLICSLLKSQKVTQAYFAAYNAIHGEQALKEQRDV
jgi:hypothetical protein